MGERDGGIDVFFAAAAAATAVIMRRGRNTEGKHTAEEIDG